MKLIKKLFTMTLVVTTFMMMVGCTTQEKNVEGNLADIMTSLYSTLADDEKPMELVQTEINADNIEYFLGSSDIDYKEALASEPAMSSIPHSVVLLRVNEGADVEAIKTTIKENVNPAKWLCVEVTPENIIVENKGDLVILIMVEEQVTREGIYNVFNEL